MKRAKHPPPIGPVTIIHRGKMHHGNWYRGTVRHNISHGLIQANVQRSDEGITWIRGHHDRRSAEAKALLAAYALRPLHPSGTLTVRARGVSFPIEFADWTHERLYQTMEDPED